MGTVSSAPPVLDQPAVLDRYERVHLVTHLLAAGRQDDVLRLMRLDHGERNWWFELRAADGDEGGYLDDLRMATEALAGGDDATVAHHVFYALAGASISARSRDLRPSLVLALIRHHLWTLDRALAHARRIPDAADRAAVLCALATSVVGPDRRLTTEALASVAQLRHPPWSQIQLLAELAPSLSGTREVAVALEILRGASGLADEVELVFERLAPNIPATLVDAALAGAAAADEDDYLSGGRLTALAVNLPAPERPRAATVAVAEVLRAGVGAGDLVDLIPLLSGEQRDEAFAALRAAVGRGQVGGDDLRRLSPPETALLAGDVLTMADEGERARTLAALVAGLAEPLRSRALAVVGRYLRTARDHYSMAEIIGHAGPHLPAQDLRQAIKRVLRHPLPGDTHGYDVRLLVRLAEHMSPAQQRRALRRVRELRHGRGPALAGLIAVLHPDVVPASLAALDEVDDRMGWMEAAVQLADRAARTLTPQLLARARLADDFAALALWAALLSGLPEDERRPLLAEVLDQLTEPHQHRDHAFDVLVTLLPADLLDHALTRLQRIDDDLAAAQTIAALLRHTAGDHDVDIAALLTPRAAEPAERPAVRPRSANEVLSAARRVERVEQRAAMVAPVLDHLPAEAGELVLAWTVEMLAGVWTEPAFSTVLRAIAPRLTADSFRAVDDALSVGLGVHSRARALGELAPHVPDELVPDLAAAALDLAAGPERGRLLSRLAPRVDPGNRPGLVETAVRDLEQPPEQWQYGGHRPELAELAPHLSEEQAVRILNASAGDDEWAEAVEAIVPWAGEDLVEEMIDLAVGLDKAGARATAEIALAARAAPDTRMNLLADAVAAVAESSDRSLRAFLLGKLVRAADGLGAASLAVLLHASLDHLAHRARPDLLSDLAALAPVLDGAALDAAHAVVETTRWWP